MVVMAPGVGSTEMRYCGISLSRMLDRTTSALWPAVPTGGVPQRMSLGCCDTAGEPARPRTATTANAANARLSMAFPLWFAVPERAARPRRAAFGTCCHDTQLAAPREPPKRSANWVDLARPEHGRCRGDEPWHIGALRARATSPRSSPAHRVAPARRTGSACRRAPARSGLKALLTRQADRVEAGQHL